MKRTTDNLKRMKSAILVALCLSAPLFSFGCVFITQRTDLSVEISTSAGMVAVGDDLTYSITVTNGYPLQVPMAYSLTQSFSLPVEILSVQPTTPQVSCSQSDNTVTCSRSGGLSPNRIDLSVTVLVRPRTAGTLISTAEIRGLVLQGDGLGLVDMDPINDRATATTTVVETNGPDLSVTLNDSPDPVLVGAELTYALTVANVGTETATNVVLTSRLPEGVIDITPGQAGCASGGNNTRTCDFGSIPSGESRTTTVVVSPIQAGELTSTAVVTTTSIDPNSGNNTATESTTVTPHDVDLAVTMTDNPDPVAVGNNVTYTVNVGNYGPATATNVLLVDEVPTNADVISINPSQGSCSESGSFRTCDLGSVANGATARLIVVVAPTAAGTINNTARVTTSETDRNSANNSATESTTVQDALLPDLSVSVSDSPDPVVINSQLAYTIMVRNVGLGAANGLRVTATLPSSVSATSRGFNCSPSGDNLVCQALEGVLQSGEEDLFTLFVTPAATGTISNMVSVTSPESDANPADNTFTENTSVIPPAPTADLSIAVSDAPDPVVVNQRVTYTVSVTNNGPATATGITLRLTLPSTVVVNDPFLSCTPSGDSIVCISQPLGQQTNGAIATFTYDVTPTATGPIIFTATVTGAENDPNRDNNTASETTTVSPPQTTADLEIVSVTDSPDPVTVNDQFIYTITVRNNGLAAATGVIVNNTLPAGVTSDGSLDCPIGSGPIFQCPVGNMASGDTRAVTLRVRSSVTGTLTNSVGAAAQETDPDPSNNTWAETTTVHPANSADVSGSIAAAPNPVTLPNDLSFTIVVQNTGPQAATGVVLTGFNVQVFEDAELLNITTTQGSCSLSSYPVLTCSVGTLANGASATVTITGRPRPGVFIRTVTANVSNNDPNLANNTASVNVTVNQ